MAQKHLHELLTEAQEPFLLKTYIAEKQSNFKKNNSITKNSKPFSKMNLCNNSCFYSQTHSPNITNSPFSGVPSPIPSKNRAQLKITQFDLSVLLEAADKIKASNLGKTQKGNVGFGVFGSIFRKFLKPGVKCEKIETLGCSLKNEEYVEMDFGCSCSSSVEKDSDRFSLSEKCFGSSPVSTFLSSLQNSPLNICLLLPENLSPGNSPLEYSSPETNPIISDIQGNDGVECIPPKHSGDEEKDQFSPVSILDPPFEDDTEQDEIEEGEDDTEQDEIEEDEDDYDMECSYALVQRAKEQLLKRLLRFEKLAELDPIELERSILETKTDDDDSDDEDEDEEELDDYKEDKSAKNFKLILKEKRKGDRIDERKVAAKIICRKVGFWEKNVFKTKIDMIVELDMRSEVDHGWKAIDRELLNDTAVEIELFIFELLVEELLREHVLGL